MTDNTPRRDPRPTSDPDRRNQRGHQRSPARARGTRNTTHQAPSARAKTTDPARYVAYDVLRAVDETDSYANLVLPKLLTTRHITGRDAALATELTYGTLRLRGRYDAIIALCSNRPLADIDPRLLDILRLGAHQLLGTRIPVHAAVSETVALARTRIGAGPSQFTNAICRRIAEHPLDHWLTRLTDNAPDPLTALATTTSHPLWITRALRDALTANGPGPDTLADLLDADNTPPRITVATRPAITTPGDHATLNNLHTTPGHWASTAHTLPTGTDPAAITALREGRIGVQDEGSQLVTLALANVPLDGPDTRWLDMCAGPGGKAALLAALATGRGARLVTNETHPHRTDLVREALAAIPTHTIEDIRTGDGRDIGADEPASYDRILLDAPCTGLGALRRRPESRWRRTTKDIPPLTTLQRQLLDSALDAIRPAGVVGYITCSPHLAETRMIIDDVLRKRTDIEQIDAAAAVRAVSADPDIALADRLDVQLWPHIHGTDAMYLALLRRREE